MAKDEEAIPTGRTRRATKAATALAPGSLRLFGSIAANLARDPERGQEVLERRAGDVADAAVDVLGSMKGGAMKVGQLVSFVDAGMVPEAYREVYQEKLATLRDSAPAMSWATVEGVLRREYAGERLDELFADIEHEPAAAASIGQVHRAELPDGRRVAVKIQYPEIADALAADVGTAAVLIRLAKVLAPGLDPQLVAGELRDRILEELDYELEAQHQRRFARYYRGHPFMHIPFVEASLSRRRVLVSEWVEGEGFEAMKALPDAERDRLGEILFRFTFGSWNRMGIVNTDVHPGNYRLRPDGSVTFLDFGNCKEFDPASKPRGIAAIKATIDNDPEALRVALHELGYLRDASKADMRAIMRQGRMMGGWYLEDRELRIDPELVGNAIAAASDPRHGVLELRTTIRVPADEIWVRRIETGVFAVLGHLRATGNWHRMSREWWFGEEPVTELGRAEAEWLREKGLGVDGEPL
jgi:predicted unusual protein kinase regulating ubiquinone biosynthesis (AarF/ABC1/UbiB family)